MPRCRASDVRTSVFSEHVELFTTFQIRVPNLQTFLDRRSKSERPGRSLKYSWIYEVRTDGSAAFGLLMFSVGNANGVGSRGHQQVLSYLSPPLLLPLP